MTPIRIGITIGDYCGIGPEVTFKAIADASLARQAAFVLAGPPAAYAYWRRHFNLAPVDLPVISPAGIASIRAGSVSIVAPEGTNEVAVNPGQPDAHSGLVAGRSIEAAVRMLRQGQLDAVVTAPVSKHHVRLGGLPFSGHTEYIAGLAGVELPVMMLLAGAFRVALVTTHLPLRQVADRITADRIIATARILAAELRRRFAIARPRIAATALNPHAGEGGDLGHEEAEIIVPALRQLQAAGLDIDGPWPADALFSRVSSAAPYDAYLAMYHDQGLIPLKMQAQGGGVNYTCGLPFIRTSPDHGTAFDIAGRNQADPRSMKEAIRLAIQLAGKV